MDPNRDVFIFFSPLFFKVGLKLTLERSTLSVRRPIVGENNDQTYRGASYALRWENKPLTTPQSHAFLFVIAAL